jgi:hypothetical protein
MLALLILCTECASAVIMVQVHNNQIVAGQSGYVDVFIQSSGTDLFTAFNYEFAIQTIGPSVGSLRFVDPQSSIESTFGNYVFNTLNGGSGGFGSVPQNSPAFDSIQGGDFAATFSDITLTSPDVLLLVRLEIEHVLPFGTDPLAASGDQFSIVLQDFGNSFFLDSSFATGPDISASSFGPAGTGMVTIGSSAAAVPEPNSVVIISLGCLVMGLRKLRFTVAAVDRAD